MTRCNSFVYLADDMIQLTRRNIPLDLLVPFVGPEFLKPFGEPGDGLFQFNDAHDLKLLVFPDQGKAEAIS